MPGLALAWLAGCWLSEAEVARVSELRPDTAETGDPPGAFEVLGVSPSFGTGAGGTDVRVEVFGGHPAMRVRFGENPATVLSASETELVVRTPPGNVGLADVTVSVDDRVKVLADGFRYYADASDRVGLIGTFAWVTYPGRLIDLETSLPYDPPDDGFAWLRPLTPSHTSYADVVFGTALNACARNPSPIADPALDLDVFALNLQGPSTTVGVVWKAENDRFEAILQSNQHQARGAWALLPVQTAAWPEMRVEAAVRTPAPLLMQSPNLGWTQLPPSVARSFDLRWDAGEPADEIAVVLERYDLGGFFTAPVLREILSCRTADDGHFVVPGDRWAGWDAGGVLRVRVARLRGTDARLPHNGAQVGVVGASWAVGDVLQDF